MIQLKKHTILKWLSIIAIISLFVIIKILLAKNVVQSGVEEIIHLKPSSCDIRQSCKLPNGIVIKTQGKLSPKTLFSLTAKNVPENTKKVYISFSMKNMDMGFNRFKLLKTNYTQIWKVQNIRLPVCITQSKDYLLDITVDDQQFQLEFKAD